jgi:hypothetical protein
VTKVEDIIAEMRRNPKGFVFKTFAKYAIPSLVRLGKKAVATESTKRPGRATHASISRMIKEWQKHIR